jgi:hypothetical protein
MSHPLESDGHRIWCRKSFDGNCKVKKGGVLSTQIWTSVESDSKPDGGLAVDNTVALRGFSYRSSPALFRASSLNYALSFDESLQAHGQAWKTVSAQISLYIDSHIPAPSLPSFSSSHRHLRSIPPLRVLHQEEALCLFRFFFHPFLNIKLTFPRLSVDSDSRRKLTSRARYGPSTKHHPSSRSGSSVLHNATGVEPRQKNKKKKPTEKEETKKRQFF